MATTASSCCQRARSATTWSCNCTCSITAAARSRSRGAPGPIGSTSTCCSAGSAITCRSRSSSSRSKNTRRIRVVTVGPRASTKRAIPASSPEHPQLSDNQISSFTQLSTVHSGWKLSRCCRTSSPMAKSNRVACRPVASAESMPFILSCERSDWTNRLHTHGPGSQRSRT